ncbi:MAG: phosphoribosylanthranilate isomerase [Saprospiraceae bacterium]
MKFPENISEISSLQPDLMGFIFYIKSKRFVGKNFSKDAMKLIPERVKKVGVFVNESFENIMAKYETYELDLLQLHGDESVQLCQQLWDKHIPVIKAMPVDDGFEPDLLKAYQPYCSYFLFDTKTAGFGGSGQTFDWRNLEKYKLETPFLLSGGLGIENIEEVLNLEHPMLQAVDLNSRIESKPGLKEREVSMAIIQKIRNHEHI